MTSRDALRQPYLRSLVEIALNTGTLTVTPAPRGTTDGEFPAGIRHLHVITAWNPRSRRLDDARNAERNVALAADLDHAGLRYLDATGRSPDGSWQEPGFALVDAHEEAVLDLAERYDQHAVYAWAPEEWAVVWTGEHRGRRDGAGWRLRRGLTTGR